jgi:hypothetical protein
MTLSSMFEKFGQDVTFKGSDGWSSATFGGFVQPLRYKNKMYLNGVNTVIGFNSQGHYLYIGPPEHDITLLKTDQWIEAADKKFTADRAEKVYFKNEVVYIWAIIREIVEVN